MKMIVPIDITPAMITATDVPKDDTYSAWSAATAYSEGDICYLESTQLRYKANAANTGVDPETDTDSTYWTEYQTATRWRPFDDVLERYASRAESLYYEITPTSFCDSIAFAGLAGGSIKIRIYNASDEKIFTGDYTLVDKSDLRNWTDFLIWSPEYLQKLTVSNLRIFAGYRVRIDFEVGAGSTAQIGEIMLGRLVTLGTSQLGVQIGGEDYSVIEANEWGERVPVERSWSDTAEYAFIIERGDEERVKQLVASRRAKLTVFLTGEDHASYGTTVFGIPKIPEITLEYHSHSLVTMEVLGYV